MRIDTLGGLAALVMLGAGCGGGTATDHGVAVSNGSAANVSMLVAASAASGAPAATARRPEDARAETEIRDLVDRVWGQYAAPAGVTEPMVFETVMTPALVTALETQEDPEAGLGFDPFCACQDYDRSRHAIRTVAIKGGHAQVAMDFWTFATDPAPRRFTIQLAPTPAGWRIDDIVTPEGGLRRER